MVSILLAALFVVPLIWLMIHAAKWSAPVTALLAVAIMSVGTTAMNMTVLKFGGGLFVFSSVLFILGGGMKGR